MTNKTNLNKVKDVALSFLHMDIEPTPYSPIVVQHPIFESAFHSVLRNGVMKIANIIEDKKAYNEVVARLQKQINEAKEVFEIYAIIRKSYKLTFMKYARNYLSVDDFSKLFADAWVASENPNDDINVSLNELISWFKSVNKKKLMTAEDFYVYNSLPNNMTVYRGVANGRNPKGLSWTANYDTAEWFANRFGDDGYIQAADISKSRVLAYFNTRGEDEIVIDTKDLNVRVL